MRRALTVRELCEPVSQTDTGVVTTRGGMRAHVYMGWYAKDIIIATLHDSRFSNVYGQGATVAQALIMCWLARRQASVARFGGRRLWVISGCWRLMAFVNADLGGPCFAYEAMPEVWIRNREPLKHVKRRMRRRLTRKLRSFTGTHDG